MLKKKRKRNRKRKRKRKKKKKHKIGLQGQKGLKGIDHGIPSFNCKIFSFFSGTFSVIVYIWTLEKDGLKYPSR